MTYRVRNIGIAIALAIVAALLTSFYVTNYKRSVQHGQKLVSVFVAARDIPAGTPGSDVVARHLLTQQQVARRNVVPGAISSPGQIAQLVASEPVYAGEQVSARRFRPLVEKGIRAQLKGTMRAFEVPGDQNQLLGGTLRAGDHVDIVASIKYKVSDIAAGTAAAGNLDRVASRVVLRDLLVLATLGSPGTAGKLTTGFNQNLSVLLAVTDSQAQKLFFVLKNGDWSLQLRPPLKAADSPGSVETIESVLGDGLGRGQFRQLYTGKEIR